MHWDLSSGGEERSFGPSNRRGAWAALALSALTVGGCGTTTRSTPPEDTTNVGGGPTGNAGGTGATGGTGASGSPSNPEWKPTLNLNGTPKYFRVVRLTNSQWAASVQEVLKLTQPSGLEASFQPPVAGVTDFSNNELLLDVGSREWSDFQSAAEKLAEQVTASDEALALVYPATNATGFIQTVGRRAFRRPLTALEVEDYTKLFDEGKAMLGPKSEFAKGAALVIRGLLQAPQFLYRTELGPAGEPLDGYEAAAKLSLWLLGTTPSEQLLDAAETLTTPGALAAEATSMLRTAAARVTMRQFHGEWLRLDRLSEISKVNVPSYDPALNAEYREASYLFFDRIFSQGQGIREILTSSRGFMGPGMAPLYGLPVQESGFVEKDLGALRAGYFSQLPYLTLNAINGKPHSIHRGLALAIDVLCAELGSPAIDKPPIAERHEGQTNRQYLDSMTESCGFACHNELLNPLGYAFEHFDGMGQYRETEQDDLPIDSSASFAFTDGRVDFADNVELMSAMASSQQTHLCYSKKLASYALQRDIVEADLPLLTELAKMSRTGSTQQVIIDLAKSDTFRAHGGSR